MSIANDARSYADNAIEAVLEQGKHALEAAQSGLDKLQHNALSAKAVGSLTPSVDAVRGTVEPLVATALTYGVKLAGKAEAAVADLKKDKRVAQVLQTGEALATAVVGAVQHRVGGVASATSAATRSATETVTKAATTAVGATGVPGLVGPPRRAAQTRPARPAAAGPATTATKAAKPTGPAKATAAKAAKAAKAAPAKAAKAAPAKSAKAAAAKAAAAKSAPAKAAASRSNGQRA